MSKRLSMLAAAAALAVVMAGPAQSASDVTSLDRRHGGVPEPATMMLLGMGLLAAVRARRRQA